MLSFLFPHSLQRTSTTESCASPTMRWPWSTSLSFPQRSGCLCTERSKPLEHHTLPLHPSSGVHILVNYCQSLSPGLSVCLSVCLFAGLFVYLYVCLSVCVCQSVCACVYSCRLFFTRSLRYNYQFIFFRGPWAIFKDSFHLREDYRDGKRRLDVAKR